MPCVPLMDKTFGRDKKHLRHRTLSPQQVNVSDKMMQSAERESANQTTNDTANV